MAGGDYVSFPNKFQITSIGSNKSRPSSAAVAIIAQLGNMAVNLHHNFLVPNICMEVLACTLVSYKIGTYVWPMRMQSIC